MCDRLDRNGQTRTDDRWLSPDPLDAPLPADVQHSVGDFLDRGAVTTLSEWTDEIRRYAGGEIDTAQLCHADGESEHRGVVDGERYDFRCFYDALVLAAIEARPVAVQTVSPSGAAIEANVADGEVSVEPPSAVFSLGISPDAAARSDGNPTLEEWYGAICPHVRAFPDREAYERWAADARAATIGLPFSAAPTVTDALVG